MAGGNSESETTGTKDYEDDLSHEDEGERKLGGMR